MKRIISGIIVTILLMGMSTSTVRIQQVKAQGTQLSYSGYPFVSVYPYNVTVTVNETFTLTVIVYNLTNRVVRDPYYPISWIPLGNLYGFNVELTWDPTIIHCTNCMVTVPFESYSTQITPSPYAGILHGYGPGNTSVWTVEDVVNESGNIVPNATDVRAWFAYATLFPASVFNGNGTICTLTFKALREGVSPLHLVTENASLLLSDVNGDPIGWSMAAQLWLNPPRDGIVTVESPIPGDLNGDGKVDISDVVLAASAYGSVRGSSNWNPKADLAPPYGIINMLDLVTIIYHYGQKYS
jgi:hypothetical protein